MTEFPTVLYVGVRYLHFGCGSFTAHFKQVVYVVFHLWICSSTVKISIFSLSNYIFLDTSKKQNPNKYTLIHKLFNVFFIDICYMHLCIFLRFYNVTNFNSILDFKANIVQFWTRFNQFLFILEPSHMFKYCCFN